MNTEQKIEAIRQNGYSLNFGTALEAIFSNYKKIALVAGAVILVMMAFFCVVWFALVIVFFTAGSFASTMTNFEAQSLTTTGVLINLLIGVISAAILAPITAGLLKMADHAENHRDFGFSTAFEFYRDPAFKALFVAALITTFSAQGIGMILQMIGKSSDSLSMAGLMNFLSILVSMTINLMTFMVVPLIVFGKLNAIDAIKASLLLVFKKFWTILLLVIVCFVCAMLGMVGFCIGIIFTLPLMNALQYVVYKSAVGIEDDSEMNQIGNTEY